GVSQGNRFEIRVELPRRDQCIDVISSRVAEDLLQCYAWPVQDQAGNRPLGVRRVSRPVTNKVVLEHDEVTNERRVDVRARAQAEEQPQRLGVAFARQEMPLTRVISLVPLGI